MTETRQPCSSSALQGQQHNALTVAHIQESRLALRIIRIAGIDIGEKCEAGVVTRDRAPDAADRQVSAIDVIRCVDNRTLTGRHPEEACAGNALWYHTSL